MDTYKVQTLITIVALTIVTIVFLQPVFMNVWTEKATLQDVYLLGFLLGLVTCGIWTFFLYKYFKT